jgi:eukaryotic-like serine/threonine-protein kinase
VIGGRYRLVKALHTGGFGRVWQAHDRVGHDDVAVKEVWLPPGLPAAERADRLLRAEREARNAATLRNHPNIVAVRDVVTEDGVPWIVMRLVTGHSLAEDLAAAGPLSAAQVGFVADSLLKALGAAHEAGIVHRDVKPANVMLTETGEVLLTDFGIAVHRADTTLTASGMLVGSMEYISPERIRGRDSKAAGDLFSLGVTLYQAVTGVSPFHRDTVAGSLAAILFEEPSPPPCAPGLAALIMRLLAKDPRQRPTVQLARGLLAALPARGASTPAAPAPATQARTRPAPKRSAPAPVTPAPKPAASAPAPRRLPPTRVASLPRRFAPTRVASPPRRLPPPSQPAPRSAARGVARRPRGRRPTWRRTRRGSGLSIAVLIALGFLGAHAAWGRDASGASAGDCVYHGQQDWRLEPCSLPPPWRDTADYKVLQRVEGTDGECTAAPGWATGDNAAVLPGMPPVTLCLAPAR